MSALPLTIVSISTFCLFKFLRGRWDTGFTPGPKPLFSPLTVFGAVLPSSAWNPGIGWAWLWRRTAYFDQTYDVIAFVPWLVGSPAYYTSSLDVMRQLLGAESKIHLEKPQDLTLARIWGHSITSANGDTWRRHRRVVTPAFSTETYSEVWNASRSLYVDMVDAEGWKNQDVVILDSVNALVIKFTFAVICRCGFGFPTSWTSTNVASEGFPEALRRVSETLIPRLIIPSWAYRLPIKTLRAMNEAWFTVTSTISDVIEKRKSETVDPGPDFSHPDILNCLVTSWSTENKHGLDERDVIANMFSLMFAGHETTASGIVSTLACLALYPEEQEKSYKEISKAFSESDPLHMIDQSKLVFTLYCFWEAQRLYPAGNMVPRQLTEDFIVKVTRPKEERMHLKKGSFFMCDLIGILRNPDTFPEPERFRPERWENVSEHDVGAFGFGPRACIGRKFAQTEALAFLSSLLYDWKVEASMLPGETRKQFEERVMDDAALNGTAFGLKHVPLKLTRRTAAYH